MVMAGLTGSPGGSTDVLGLYFYRTAFGSVTNGIQDFRPGQRACRADVHLRGRLLIRCSAVPSPPRELQL